MKEEKEGEGNWKCGDKFTVRDALSLYLPDEDVDAVLPVYNTVRKTQVHRRFLKATLERFFLKTKVRKNLRRQAQDESNRDKILSGDFVVQKRKRRRTQSTTSKASASRYVCLLISFFPYFLPSSATSFCHSTHTRPPSNYEEVADGAF